MFGTRLNFSKTKRLFNFFILVISVEILNLVCVVSMYMKKTNNKYRNNNNYSNIYSLNYKFDSCSIAGKFSGTALDLIKRYNELAKEAHSNGDYINAEVFRQYAEHYRKIVTEINEKKNQNSNVRSFNNSRNEDAPEAANSDLLSDAENNKLEEVGTDIIEQAKAQVIDINTELKAEPEVNISDLMPSNNPAPAASVSEKKSFTVIEIKPEASKSELIENKEEVKPRVRRTYRKKAEAV